MTHSFIGILHSLLPRLFSLTETSFDFDEVRGQCLDWGWKLDDEIVTSGVARFRLEDGYEAVFDSGKAGGLNGRAYLWIPVCYWPDDEDSQGGDAQEYLDRETGGERQDFDARFEVSCDEVRRFLGTPASVGKFEYGHRKGWPYAYAVWCGERGFLVLQQDEMDIQFGFDISSWILARKKGEALPSFPLTAEGTKSEPAASTASADPLWDGELDG